MEAVLATHTKYGFSTPTLLHATFLVDRLFSLYLIRTESMGLIGGCCLLLAAKCGEVQRMHVGIAYEVAMHFGDLQFVPGLIADIEVRLVTRLGLDLHYPDALVLLQIAGKKADVQPHTLSLATELLKFTTLHPEFINVVSSLRAAACLWLARVAQEKDAYPVWS